MTATRSDRRFVWIFLSFASAYFLSALLRAVPATLAPVLSQELGLGASQLGLLAGAYFLGFAMMQVPLGTALDRHGPKRVLLVLLAAAVAGCALSSMSGGLATIVASRFLVGIGVSACLMAPLTAYRGLLAESIQQRANSWMLMTGSLGMLASTVPVQMLLPALGWRGLFGLLAVLMLASMALIAAIVPSDDGNGRAAPDDGDGYGQVWRDGEFRRMAPLGFVLYGGLIAMQALWIGPWLTTVSGVPPDQAARGLLWVNGSMLLAFLSWGAVTPALARQGWGAARLIAAAWPVSVIGLLSLAWLGPQAGPGAWALWCVSTSAVTLSQPAVAMAFPRQTAGRALTAFNLVVFLGVFATQWGIGMLVDGLLATGWPRADALRAAAVVFAALSAAAGTWFAIYPRRGRSGRG